MAKPTLDEIFGNNTPTRPSLNDIFLEQNKIDQPIKWTPEMQAKYEAMNIPQGSVAGGFARGTFGGLGHGLERVLNGVTLGGYGWANNKLGLGYDERKKALNEAGLAGQIAGGATELVGGILPFVMTGGGSGAVQGTGALAKTASLANKVNYARPINAFVAGKTGIASGVPYLGKAVSGAETLARNGLVGAGMSGLNSGFNNDFDVDQMIEDAKTGAYTGMALPAAGYALKGAGNLTSGLLGITTGTGRAVKQAFEAGKRKSQAFINQMRGNGDKFEPVYLMKNELQKIQKELSNNYRQGINTVFKNEQSINPKPLYESFYNLVDDLNYKGFSKAGSTTQRTIGRIEKILKEFSSNKKLHTPEGLDALKQRIGDITIPQGELGAKRVKDIVYNNVSKMINEKAPAYANVMKKYAQGKELARQAESTFGIGGNKAPEVSLKKIQSVFKNDRGSTWGARTDLATPLNGASNQLFDSVAGQALSSTLPRGLKAGIGVAGTAASSIVSPSALVALPTFSPRIVGEAAYGLGRGVSHLDQNTLRKLFYGSLPQLMNNQKEKK